MRSINLASIVTWAAIGLGLAACTYDVPGMARCHEGAFVSFCVVNVGPGQQLIGSASGVVPALGNAATGAGIAAWSAHGLK
jgi:hypothetical protein